MKALSVRLEDNLGTKFDRVCRQLGYKKNTVVARLIQTFVQSQTKKTPPLPKEDSSKDDPFLAVVGLANIKPLLRSADDLDAFLYQL